MSEGSTKEIMTCDEVADYLRVHVSSVRRWSRSGKIIAYRIGGWGEWRYREQDVLAFLYDADPEGEGHGGGDGDVTGIDWESSDLHRHAQVVNI